MLPIVLSHRWSESAANGLAYALGRACEVAPEKDDKIQQKEKTQQKEKNKSLLTQFKKNNFQSAVLRGMAHTNKTSKRTPPTVLQFTEQMEIGARALSALHVLQSPGPILVVDSTDEIWLTVVQQHHVLSMTQLKDGQTIAEYTKNIVVIVFLGAKLVDEIKTTWPAAVTPDNQPLVVQTVDDLSTSTTTTTKTGLLHRKTTFTTVKTPFRLLHDVDPALPVAILTNRVRLNNGSTHAVGLLHALGETPFVFVGRHKVNIFPHGGYFRYNRAQSKRSDWANLVEPLLEHVL